MIAISKFPVAALAALVLLFDLAGGPATALGDRTRPLKSIALITIDDDGRNLRYPSSLFFDPVEQEIYLVNGGASRVVVYGPDYFPLASIGLGRGVDSPRGVYVTPDGTVYVSQSPSRENPHHRITILNGAFFVEREILLDEIPEAADFTPSQIAVSRDGLMYLSGTAKRGVLVLDQDGNFLRRLEPMDMISDQEAIAAAAARREAEQQQKAADRAAEPEPPAVPEADDPDQPGPRSRQELEAAQREAEQQLEALARAAERDPWGDIPEEFRPRSEEERAAARVELGLGPVRVQKVVIDREGNLFLVSAETGRIYVYSPEETFLFAFGEKGGTPGKLSQPRSVAIDENRKLLYVTDYMRHTILAYDFNGRFRFELGGWGDGPGWFNFPVDITLNRQDQLVVADLFNRRVQVLEVEHGAAFPEVPITPAVPPSPGEFDEEPVLEEPDALPQASDLFEVIFPWRQDEDLVEELAVEDPPPWPADFEIVEELLPVVGPEPEVAPEPEEERESLE